MLETVPGTWKKAVFCPQEEYVPFPITVTLSFFVHLTLQLDSSSEVLVESSGCSRVAVKVTVMESTAWASAFKMSATAGISSYDEQAARIPAAAANTAKLIILFLIMFTVLAPASAIVFFIVEITWRCVLQVATEIVPFQDSGLRRAVRLLY